MDWAAHLKHLQIVFQEFDADMVISKPFLIRLFCNNLRLSIHAQAKQDGCQKDIWEQAIKKTITAKAKAALNFPSWVREIDACCLCSHQSSFKADKYIKEKIFNRNSFGSQEPKSQPPQCSKNTKTSDWSWKNHKNNRRNRKSHYDCGPCGLRFLSSTPATGANTTNFLT